VRDDPHATAAESWFEVVQRADLLRAETPAVWRSRDERVSEGDRANGGVAQPASALDGASAQPPTAPDCGDPVGDGLVAGAPVAGRLPHAQARSRQRSRVVGGQQPGVSRGLGEAHVLAHYSALGDPAEPSCVALAEAEAQALAERARKGDQRGSVTCDARELATEELDAGGAACWTA
jgi:hypothetical protein